MKILQRSEVRLALTGLCLGAVVVYIGPRHILEAFQGADLGLLLGVSLLTVPLIMTKILRWMILVRLEMKAGFYAVGVSYLMGLMLSIFTPAGAGEVGRAAFLPNSEGHQARLGGKALLDKLVDLTVLALFAAVGLILYGQPLGFLMLIGVVAGAAFAVWLSQRSAATTSQQTVLGRVLHSMAQTPLPSLAAVAGLAALGFTALYLELFGVMRAFDSSIPYESAFVFPIITLSTILPITINGLGVREWTAVVVLGSLESSVVANAVFVHFLIVNLPPALLGLLLWWRMPGQETALSHEPSRPPS